MATSAKKPQNKTKNNKQKNDLPPELESEILMKMRIYCGNGKSARDFVAENC